MKLYTDRNETIVCRCDNEEFHQIAGSGLWRCEFCGLTLSIHDFKKIKREKPTAKLEPIDDLFSRDRGLF